MNHKDIRWKQRFKDFEKTLKNLERALKVESPDDIYRAGIIKFFEVSFELAWKTLKDYLEASGYLVKSPRGTIQQAFKDEIIQDGHAWIEALERRNLMSHTYNEKLILEAESIIRDRYFTLLQQVYEKLKNE